MSNFVDIHHHLIYGMDDGAQTQEEMQVMILRAAEQGITEIVCTPHVTPGVERFQQDWYEEHLAQAQAFIRARGLDMHLHKGCEVLYTDASARMAGEGKYPTLAGSDLVLVEFSPDVSFHRLCEAAQSFAMAGYSVLFAHVERYEALRKMKCVRTLRDEYGVYMQMNASTILHKQDFFTKRWVSKMLAEGNIDCVATDAHGLSSRRCRMMACHQRLTERYGKDIADELCGGFQRRMLEI